MRTLPFDGELANLEIGKVDFPLDVVFSVCLGRDEVGGIREVHRVARRVYPEIGRARVQLDRKVYATQRRTRQLRLSTGLAHPQPSMRLTLATQSDLHRVPDLVRGVHVEVPSGIIGPSRKAGAGLVPSAMALATRSRGGGALFELAARVELAGSGAIGCEAVAVGRVPERKREAVAIGQIPVAVALVVEDAGASGLQQALAFGARGGAGILGMNCEGNGATVGEDGPNVEH